MSHGLLACLASTLARSTQQGTDGRMLRAVPEPFEILSDGATGQVSSQVHRCSTAVRPVTDLARTLQNSFSVPLQELTFDEQGELLQAILPRHLAPHCFLQGLLLRVLDEISFASGSWRPAAEPGNALCPSTGEHLAGQRARASEVPALTKALAREAAGNWDRACKLARQALAAGKALWDVQQIDVPPGTAITMPGLQTQVYLVLHGSGTVTGPSSSKTSQSFGVAAGDMVGELAALLWHPAGQRRTPFGADEQVPTFEDGLPGSEADGKAAVLELDAVPGTMRFRSTTQMRLLVCSVKQVMQSASSVAFYSPFAHHPSHPAGSASLVPLFSGALAAGRPCATARSLCDQRADLRARGGAALHAARSEHAAPGQPRERCARARRRPASKHRCRTATLEAAAGCVLRGHAGGQEGTREQDGAQEGQESEEICCSKGTGARWRAAPGALPGTCAARQPAEPWASAHCSWQRYVPRRACTHISAPRCVDGARGRWTGFEGLRVTDWGEGQEEGGAPLVQRCVS